MRSTRRCNGLSGRKKTRFYNKCWGGYPPSIFALEKPSSAACGQKRDIQSCLGSVGFRDELSGKTLGPGFRDRSNFRVCWISEACRRYRQAFSIRKRKGALPFQPSDTMIELPRLIRERRIGLLTPAQGTYLLNVYSIVKVVRGRNQPGNFLTDEMSSQ